MDTTCNGRRDDGCGVMVCALLGPGQCSALQLLRGKVQQGAPRHFPRVPCKRHSCSSSHVCSAPPEGAELPVSLWPELVCVCIVFVCVCICLVLVCIGMVPVCVHGARVCAQCSSCAISAVKGASVAPSAECCLSLHHMQGCALWVAANNTGLCQLRMGPAGGGSPGLGAAAPGWGAQGEVRLTPSLGASVTVPFSPPELPLLLTPAAEAQVCGDPHL